MPSGVTSSISCRPSRRTSSTCFRSAPQRPSRSRSAGRSSKTSERSSSSASWARSRSLATCSPRRGGIRSSRVRAASAVSSSPNSFCADGVVEIEREPVALRDDRELARLLVQAGVRDRDRGVRGEQPDQLLVLVGEVCGTDLLRQIEGADHARRRDDRHAEERAHVRMPLRPPAAETWVLVDVARAVRAPSVVSMAPSTPCCRGSGPKRGDQLVAHARGEEACGSRRRRREARARRSGPRRARGRCRRAAAGRRRPTARPRPRARRR